MGFTEGNILAAETSTSTLAQREIQRRNQLIQAAEQRLIEADQLAKEEKFEAALVIYRQTYASLPDTPMTQEIRLAARTGYTSTACVRAKELMVYGNRKEAVALLDEITGPNVDPHHSTARDLRRKFEDADRWPPSITPEHVVNVSEVKDLLLKANSAYEIGTYDEARALYQEVLRKDPYNVAARRGMERAEQARERYFDAARDQRRIRMLNDINGLWEDSVPVKSQDISALFGGNGNGGSVAQSGRQSIIDKLRSLIIPKIEFSGAALSEVMEYLRVRSRDMDPSGKGIDFVLNMSPEMQGRTVTVQLNNVPVEEVLRYVTQMTETSYKVDEFAVRLVSMTEAADTITSKQWRVPPDFIQRVPVGAAAVAPDAATAPAFAVGGAEPAAGTTLTMKRMGAQEYLQSQGIPFPAGTSASYSAATNLLVVRNSIKNLELVDELVSQANAAGAKLAHISVRILDVSQTNLDELGFDWLMGPSSLGSGSFINGGSQGNSLANSGGYPFPTAGLNPMTSGLRSGDLSVPRNSITSLLQNADLGVGAGAASGLGNIAPGVFGLRGAVHALDYLVLMRGLNQKKGVDILSVPSVTTKSGVKASIEVTREMLYPTEFDPPQLPPTPTTVLIDQFGNIVLQDSPRVVTPTTPTAFDTRKTGVILEVEPVISDDGRSIDLTLTPSHTEFEGFVNYGSPIFDPLGEIGDNMLTDNRILQPIFNEKKIATGVRIWDGATVVLGGLMRDESVTVNDKVPILGDLPFVGRLWQSKTQKSSPRCIMFFVTVKVVDPSGQPIARTGVAAQP